MTTARYYTSDAFRGRALQRAAVAFIVAAMLCAGAAPARTRTPQEEEEMDTTRTPAGELTLVRRREGEAVTVVIKLNGRVVAEKRASSVEAAYDGASFQGLYPQHAPRYALVSFSTGALVCGAKFTIVDWSRKEAARVSSDFGNCSAAPRVTYRRGALTITFPAGSGKHDPGSHYVGPGQVWIYSDGRLRRARGRR